MKRISLLECTFRPEQPDKSNLDKLYYQICYTGNRILDLFFQRPQCKSVDYRVCLIKVRIDIFI